MLFCQITAFISPDLTRVGLPHSFLTLDVNFSGFFFFKFSFKPMSQYVFGKRDLLLVAKEG